MRVQRGVLKENSWYVLRRYNDFLALHELLLISGICLPLPAKRIFGKSRFNYFILIGFVSSSEYVTFDKLIIESIVLKNNIIKVSSRRFVLICQCSKYMEIAKYEIVNTKIVISI